MTNRLSGSVRMNHTVNVVMTGPDQLKTSTRSKNRLNILLFYEYEATILDRI